jgi:hypothetical protein
MPNLTIDRPEDDEVEIEGDHESVGEALGHVAEAGQRLLIDRFDLAMLRLQMSAGYIGAWSAAGVTMLAAWVLLVAALGVFIAMFTNAAIGLACVGALHLLLAITFVAIARNQRLKKERISHG